MFSSVKWGYTRYHRPEWIYTRSKNHTPTFLPTASMLFNIALCLPSSPCYQNPQEQLHPFNVYNLSTSRVHLISKDIYVYCAIQKVPNLMMVVQKPYSFIRKSTRILNFDLFKAICGTILFYAAGQQQGVTAHKIRQTALYNALLPAFFWIPCAEHV